MTTLITHKLIFACASKPMSIRKRRARENPSKDEDQKNEDADRLLPGVRARKMISGKRDKQSRRLAGPPYVTSCVRPRRLGERYHQRKRETNQIAPIHLAATRRRPLNNYERTPSKHRTDYNSTLGAR